MAFTENFKSGISVDYYTIYDKFNKREQFYTDCKTKHLALIYCYELFKTDSLIQSDVRIKSYSIKRQYLRYGAQTNII